MIARLPTQPACDYDGDRAEALPTARPDHPDHDPAWPAGYETPSTGFLQVGARDYDPDLGRWLQPDPVAVGPEAMSGVLNRWAYCANDPVSRSDPTGTIAPALAIGVLLLIVGAALEEVLSRALLNSTLRLLGKWMCSRLLDQVYGFGLLGLVGMGLIAIGLIIGRIPGLGLLGVPFALVGYILLGFSLLVTAAFVAIWDWIVASSYQTKRAEYDLFNDHYALLHGSVALLPFQPNTGNYPTRLVEQVRV